MIKYRKDLDILKGVAIICVVLYHMGICHSGYLGVDVFFVINGFLIIPKVIDSLVSNQFKYFNFLLKRTLRLLPLLLLISGLSMLSGFFIMLPDDYENLSESVVATSFFSNNILASITTKNYWEIVNDYKPLMHTWYVGILFEFYIFFPLIMMLTKWLALKMHFSFHKVVFWVLSSLSLLSLCLYLNPMESLGNRFYLLHCRLYELLLGGLCGWYIRTKRNGKLFENSVISNVVILLLLFLVFMSMISFNSHNIEHLNLVTAVNDSPEGIIPQSILLIMTVVVTMSFCFFNNIKSHIISLLDKFKIVGAFGVMSYSIYIWHQPILAFYRYCFSKNITIIFTTCFFIVILLLSFITYQFVEKRIKNNRSSLLSLLFTFILINISAFYIYKKAGVIRDVPELDINTNIYSKNLHTDYVDRINAYDCDFSEIDNGKINVLVIGNSFARDWSNILLESEMNNQINLSYIYHHLSINYIEEDHNKYIQRVTKADYVFIFDWKTNIPEYIWTSLKNKDQIYGIGVKNFGECNGIIYKKRFNDDYFQQTVKINPVFFNLNEKLRADWQNRYVNLLDISTTDNGKVRVFTDDNKFISNDCRHLTQAGAKFFAKRINFKSIFSE